MIRRNRFDAASNEAAVHRRATLARACVAGSRASAGLEETVWLCPIEDRRALDSTREGMIEGFSQGNYLVLVDYTGRIFRDGKAAISAELSGILERLGSSVESWRARLLKLRSGRLPGPITRVDCDRPSVGVSFRP
jgi:hypothetical protein